jgi:hypothetical protein
MISRRSYASLSEAKIPNSPFNQHPVRHLIGTIEIAVAYKVASVAFTYMVPEWKEVAEDVDGVVFIGLLVILGIKLLWGFLRGNGLPILVAA